MRGGWKWIVMGRRSVRRNRGLILGSLVAGWFSSTDGSFFFAWVSLGLGKNREVIG